MSTTQVAQMLGVHPTTVRHWARAGRIEHWLTPTGHIRFRASDIAALVKNSYPAAEGPAA